MSVLTKTSPSGFQNYINTTKLEEKNWPFKQRNFFIFVHFNPHLLPHLTTAIKKMSPSTSKRDWERFTRATCFLPEYPQCIFI